ncbi:MAG: sarcosine oxidase subunit gamma [Gammaproteobacteria bacterium]|nr:sarcosine oxidase subunit gamma [Gammaproteobacteria bacterium]
MSYEVEIKRGELEALVDLQGSSQAIADWVEAGFPKFPTEPNTTSTEGTVSLYWVAPERWLLRAPLTEEDRLIEMTRPDEAPLDISVVLVSDTLSFFHIEGPDAAQIVAIACPLDTHPLSFPPNGASYTEIFGVKGLLARRVDGFDIAIESSFADMIEDYLQRATA